MAISEETKKWRRSQAPGAIMKPSTFASIEKKAASSGKYRNPEAVAGAAYWRTVNAKSREARKKRIRRMGSHS